MRRFYPDLNEIEKEIIKFALTRERVARDELIDELTEAHEEDEVRQALTSLCNEHRMFRLGNRAEYVMSSRNLF